MHSLIRVSVTIGVVIGFLSIVCSAAFGESNGELPRDVTQIVEQLDLRSIDSATVELATTDAELTVFCFLGTECPLAKLYGPRLQVLADEFASRGVRFVAIGSNLQDSVEELKTYADACAITFPICKDYDNVVADLFSAERTPEVFVVDGDNRLRYRGRIDDQYSPGAARAIPTRHDLRLAMEQILSGIEVAVPHVEAVGCLIGRIKTPVSDSSVTYANQVARVLQTNCIECHREGQIGPFSLTDYDEAIGWGEMMVEVIEDRRMPPWHANPDHGEFANARFMPDADKQIIREWVDAGMPFGDKSDLPEPMSFTDGWRLPREPDLVITMRDRPFVVPADGTVEYQYFVVDPGFEEDKWITAAEVMPGNRSVVHHSIVFIRPPDGGRFRGVNWLTAYVPGQANPTYLPNRARRVPAGSKLVFQQHYTPNGTEQSDLSSVGILFGNPDEITHEAYTLIGIDQDFVIPPGESSFKVSSRLRWIPRDAELLGVAPHMHLRGKSFRLFAKHGDGQDVLLDVPKYDFNWQHVYEFKKPIPFAEVSELDFDVVFDNSTENPVNPNPNEHVCWGDQTWEEMAVAFFEVAEPIKKSRPDSQSHDPVVDALEPAIVPERQTRIDDFVEKFFAKFDKNNDNQVSKSETTFAFQKFSFHLFNPDNDEILSRDEVIAAAESRIQ